MSIGLLGVALALGLTLLTLTLIHLISIPVVTNTSVNPARTLRH